MAWTNQPPLATACNGLAAAAADALPPIAGYSIYAIGGNDGSGPVAVAEAFNTTSGTWSPVPPMLTARLNLAAASGPDRVYALAGSDGTGLLANNEIFNPAGHDWTAGSPLPAARDSLGAATLTVGAGETGGFYLSGKVPSDAQVGDVFLVNVEAHYPAAESSAEQKVDYLEVIYVKKA